MEWLKKICIFAAKKNNQTNTTIMRIRIIMMLAALCVAMFMLNSTSVSAQGSGNQVEAKIRKAKQIYEYSVGNPAKNKKTDFVKLVEAKAIIEQVINSISAAD